MSELLVIRGARTHNLKNVDVDIPLDGVVTVVGPSGSGKTSLTHGTVHALAQAAFLEGFSSYAQHAVSRLRTPDVDEVLGLRPTIAISQGSGRASSRSTVGTATGALDLLRLLYSRLGTNTQAGAKRLDAGDFSFNKAESACTKCHALGESAVPDPKRLFDFDKTLTEGAILHSAYRPKGRYWNILAMTGKVPMNVPLRDFTAEQIDFLLWQKPYVVTSDTPGQYVQSATYEGIGARMLGRLRDPRDGDRAYDKAFCEIQPCDSCFGTRLAEQPRSVVLDGVRFDEALLLELNELRRFVGTVDGPVADAINRRLVPLLDRTVGMGLDHLTLARGTNTLSGGEMQRIKLAHEVSSPLGGMLYVIDEPTAGLHFTESSAVYETLKALANRNTVLLVDHSPGALDIADHVVELGPGGGSLGGSITFNGPVEQYEGEHGRLFVPRRHSVAIDEHSKFEVVARSNNLKGETVEIPRQRFVVLAGRSGSGKSSLARDIQAQIPGAELLTQGDLTGSRRSVIATYLGVFDGVRKIYASESGLSESVFSFNAKKGGACTSCDGWGIHRVDMQFLEDVDEPCEACDGKRYQPEILDIKVNDLNIADVLDLTIDQAAELFADRPALRRPLEIAQAVGMGHLVLGQSTDTLSGGEGQRLRISKEIATGTPPVYILDEPTRGLGRQETEKFLGLVDKLLDEGHTVIAIEHNLPVISAADWVIELGPGSGNAGGSVVAAGSPEEIRAQNTLTGQALQTLDEKTNVVTHEGERAHQSRHRQRRGPALTLQSDTDVRPQQREQQSHAPLLGARPVENAHLETPVDVRRELEHPGGHASGAAQTDGERNIGF